MQSNQKFSDTLRKSIAGAVREVAAKHGLKVRQFARQCRLPESTVDNYALARTLPELDRFAFLLKGAGPHADILVEALVTWANTDAAKSPAIKEVAYGRIKPVIPASRHRD